MSSDAGVLTGPDRLNGRLAQLQRVLPVLAAIGGGVLIFVIPYTPWVNGFDIFLLTRGMAFGIWAMGLVILTGYTGLVSFGQAAWLAIGAYSGGYLAREYTDEILLVILVAIGVCFVFAALSGLIVTRVSGVPFAIVTLAVSAIVWSVANQLPERWLGGATGFFGVPTPTIFGISLESRGELHFAIAGIAVVVFLLLHHLVHTPFGRTLQAIRENEQRSRFLGINVTAHKWAAYVIASVVGGIGGAMFVLLIAGISPHDFIWVRSGDVLIMVIVGGLGSIYGPILGAIFFSMVQSKLNTFVPEQEVLYLGLIFLGAVLFLGGGFAGVIATIYDRAWGVIWRIFSPSKD